MITDRKMRVNKQSGFTIIEMMIASAALSVILLVSTIIIINIGDTFYRINAQSSVQDNVSSITNEISQHLINAPNIIITNTLPSGGTPGHLCIDTTRYTYVIGKQMSDTPTASQTYHVLWRDNLLPGQPCNTPPLPNMNVAVPSNGGTELLIARSRLTAFCVGSYNQGNPIPCVTSAISPYNVTIGAAYGDDNLLTQPSGTNAACKGSIGDHFCATSYLVTIATNRMTPGP